MELIAILGLIGMVGWGAVCSVYVWRDRAVTLLMFLPLIAFMFMIAAGVE